MGNRGGMDDKAAAYHALDAGAVLQAMQAPPGGLDPAEAARRLARHGPNALPAPPRRGPLRRLLAQFRNILIHVLLGCAAITALLGHGVDTGVILAVVAVNALVGFVQEGRAEQAMAAIRDMLAPEAAVLRGGHRQTVAAADLVPGDIVLLAAGDLVPADLRLTEARALRVSEALLTGESVPVDKSPAPVAAEAALGDRTPMLFSGTMVAAGTGRGVVVATGGATQIGRISGMIARVETLTTPLVQQMHRFGRWLTLFILLGAGLLLGYGSAVGRMPFDELFMVVVGLSVAAIPEGLPAVLTITLAVGVQAMARRNAIVRRLPAIETLGAVSVICTDKTGTLTRNEMEARTLFLASCRYAVAGVGYAPEGRIDTGAGAPAGAGDALLAEAGRIAALCNDAVLRQAADGWQVEGDPMEGALRALAGRIGGVGGALADTWQRRDEIPFDAAHRYMAVLDRGPGGAAAIHAKGAPEAILPLCADQRAVGGGTAPLDPGHWHALVERLAADGQRVIALAHAPADPGQQTLAPGDLAGRLTLVGLVGLIDPPRPEAVAAVADCRAAGIRVKMITGDHAATARAIAAQVGLEAPGQVLTGADLDAMDDAALAEAALRTDVFARTSPAHKLRLVTALQARGLTVAMTGDGVNDAPALKRADAGIAMGRKGSAAAREAADLVLADDNFASVAAAVREGRTVFDNIRKVISWTLPTNAGEALTIILALFLGMTLPITAVQILWVNLVTAATLGLALAFEPPEPGTMRRPPRPRDEPLLNGGLVWQIVFTSGLFAAAVFGLYLYATARGHPVALAQTMAMNMLVVLEVLYLFYIRNSHGTSLTWAVARGTPAVWLCIGTVVVAQLAVTYLPALQALLGTVAVPVGDAGLILGVGVVFFALIETEKQMRLALAPPRPG